MHLLNIAFFRIVDDMCHTPIGNDHDVSRSESCDKAVISVVADSPDYFIVNQDALLEGVRELEFWFFL